jgi:proline iminopeptidase
MVKTVTGFVEVYGFKLYYEIFGEGVDTLLCLHGGPGATHNYLNPLSRLAEDGIRVVMYDQLGCGKSDRPPDSSLYKIEIAAEEVEGVRNALKLNRVHLLGQSYGGFLALQYALKYQQNIRKLILSNTAASIPRERAELEKLRNQLPIATRQLFERYEASGDLHNPEYEGAIKDHLYRKYLCRMKPWPPEVEAIFSTLNPDIYEHMWGPNEFVVTGNLRDWDVTKRLREISRPTLIIVGRYDELVPALSEDMRREIPDSQLTVFEAGSHLVMYEEPKKYLSTIANFLKT